MICQRNNLLCCFDLVIPVLFLVLGAHMFYIVLSLILTSRISLIFDPPLPMRDPHWLAGTTSRRVTGGLGTVGVFCKSCKKYIINWLISISHQFDSIYFRRAIQFQYAKFNGWQFPRWTSQLLSPGVSFYFKIISCIYPPPFQKWNVNILTKESFVWICMAINMMSDLLPQTFYRSL